MNEIKFYRITFVIKLEVARRTKNVPKLSDFKRRGAEAENDKTVSN